MKRPPGLWLLLSAGVLWLTVQNVHGIKATSLIFGKTTTTSSPETSSIAGEGEQAAEQSTEGSADVSSNTTKPTLTGIPQIDYIWDPNLPRELNGYNLTEYPFYDRVPEDIDFKCDGLHDGFYASVPHKCQVYHHCLFGTRYDFLCANYTAFDQKTFICHFVSEVDCVNSKKFWHRNDALYQTASTTTVKPVVVSTHPPQPAAPPPSSVVQSAPGAPVAPRRPVGGRRRPFRRRRPQYDYYDYEDYETPRDDRDDYYEESRSRKRPRPRPRPIYDDDYEEYEDDRYERRGPGRRDEERRRPYYNRRGYGNRRPTTRRNKNDRKNYEDDEEYEYEAPRYNRNKNKKEPQGAKRPDESVEEYERPRKSTRRPVDDTYYDDEPIVEKRPLDRKRPNEDEDERRNSKPHDGKMIIKPVSGSSVYDRPRTAPRVRPPVPKHEQDKFAYKHVAVANPPKVQEEVEYYDDYEDEVPIKADSKPTTRSPEVTENKRPSLKHSDQLRDDIEETVRQTASSSRPRGYSSKRPVDEEPIAEPKRSPFRHPPRTKFNLNRYGRPGNENSKQPPANEYYDDYDETDNVKNSKESVTEEKSTSTTTTTTTTAAPSSAKENREQVVRVVKRPFLPSRGGNPYTSRGLKPVGAKVAEITEDAPKSDTDDHDHLRKIQNSESQKRSEDYETDDSHAREEDEKVVEQDEEKPAFKPSPVIKESHEQEDEDFRPISNRPLKQTYKPTEKVNEEPIVTEKNRILPKTPFDELNESEYDVTLNDALNPTLPNLPVRAFPTGFSSDDVSHRNLRPRLTSSGTDLAYQIKLPSPASTYNPNRHFVNRNAEYTGQYSTLSGQINPQYRQKIRITQAQTNPFYAY